ncbi:hypothetical protein [Streptomyces sp. CC219B]|uniref:hypothetical protein n=1 Tax=Streptomyces sp. CC219B TaxID=3044574 RepID=UPI0024A8F625|nr:hypothetical protein [Streptomyces sp. CC219B]
MGFVNYFPGQGTLLEKAYTEGEAKGEVNGKVRAVLAVLEARDIPVSDDIRERVTTCTDINRIDGWLRRAVTATRAEDLFAEDPSDDA